MTRQSYDRIVLCPICRQPMTAAPRRMYDGWHDIARCCERSWDTCCQLEFRQPSYTTAEWARLHAAIAKAKGETTHDKTTP